MKILTSPHLIRSLKMDKAQMWEVLQTCHLASSGMSYEDLITEGFNPGLAKIGVQLCSYLKSKNVLLIDERRDK